MNKYSFSFLLILLFSFVNCNKISKDSTQNYVFDIFNGINLEGPPERFEKSAFEQLKETNANSVGVTPYAFLDSDTGKIHTSPQYQWWGESEEGIKATIIEAHENKLKVMLKPHVWVKGQGWAGNLELEGQSLSQWKSDYKEYIMLYAKMAEEEQVYLYCIGTEFRYLTQEKEYWEDLIKAVRKVYSGKVVYAANWDNYENISFWKSLDFIGIDAYFPLKKKDEKLSKALLKYNALVLKRKLYQFARQERKPFIFTEYGYKSLKNSSAGHWNSHKKEVDEHEQALCFDVMMDIFEPDTLYNGGFIWKWHLVEKHHKDSFSPQGKKAEQTITKYFTKY